MPREQEAPEVTVMGQQVAGERERNEQPREREQEHGQEAPREQEAPGGSAMSQQHSRERER